MVIKTEEGYCECASDKTYRLYRDLKAEGVVYVFQVISDDDFIQKWSFSILNPALARPRQGGDQGTTIASFQKYAHVQFSRISWPSPFWQLIYSSYW